MIAEDEGVLNGLKDLVRELMLQASRLSSTQLVWDDVQHGATRRGVRGSRRQLETDMSATTSSELE